MTTPTQVSAVDQSLLYPSPYKEFWQAFSKNKGAVAGLLFMLLIVFCAIFAPWVAPHNPSEQYRDFLLTPPAWLEGGQMQFLLGTDELGRDIFSRVVYGARITLMIVVLVAVISAPLGLLIGAVSGYFGGWVDKLLMGITDVFLSMPKLILALAFVAALGPGIENAIIAIAITSWPAYARIARAETLTFRNAEFIAATRLLGASQGRIILRHVLPLCTSSMIVRVALDMAGIILTAAGLGFLGLGAQPPTPEWGAMLNEARADMVMAPHVALFPAIAIFLTVLAFNLLGDGLRDALDPRIKG